MHALKTAAHRGWMVCRPAFASLVRRLLVVGCCALAGGLLLVYPTPAHASSCGNSIHTAGIYNTSTYVTYINDTCWAPGGSGDLVFATPNGSNLNPVDKAALGVWYSPYNYEWSVFNEDISNIILGSQFDVVDVAPYQDATSAAFMHVATSSNSGGDLTYLSNSVLNGHPNMTMQVIAAYVPGHGLYDTHALGVWYDSYYQQWSIFHEDGTPIPNNAAYFVYAWPLGQCELAVTASPSNLANGAVIINHWCYNGQASMDVTVTQQWTGTFNPHTLEVQYNPSTTMWEIHNADGSPIPAGASFMVW